MSPTRSVYVRLGDLAERLEPRYYDRLDSYLRGARMGVTYRSYMAHTYVYAGVVALVSLFVAAGFVAGFGFPREAWLAPPLVAAGLGYVTHAVRVYYPRYVADVRAEQIDVSLPGVASFIYALVRGGVPLAEVLDTVSEHPEVFGEAATEFGVASRDVEHFGGDVVTALRRLSQETPSDEMSEFLKNFVSVVIRKEDVSGYLGEKAEEFHDEAEARQENLLERLEVLAEVYVVVFVAAPLLAITVLVVVGFVGAATLVSLRALIYLLMPLAGVGFIVLLDVLFEAPSKPEETETDEGSEAVFVSDVPESRTATEGAEENNERLDAYEKRERLIEYARSPVDTLRKEPRVSLYLGVAIGAAYIVANAALFFYSGGSLPDVQPSFGFAFTETTEAIINTVDDTLVEATMITLFVYSVFYQMRAEYLKGVQDKLPEMLGSLSTTNQAGVPFLQALTSLREVEMGVLNRQVEMLGRDILWNSTAKDALRRFDNRSQSPAVTRMRVLLNNTSEASGKLGQVLDIAERDAKLRRRLAQQRQEQMSLYTVVIYVSFLVFIVIIAVLSTVFMPAASEVGEIPQLEGGFNPDAYRTLFYHATVVQALLSGLIAGKMTSGRVSTGAKHAFIMVAVAYLTFNFFLLLV